MLGRQEGYFFLTPTRNDEVNLVSYSTQSSKLQKTYPVTVISSRSDMEDAYQTSFLARHEEAESYPLDMSAKEPRWEETSPVVKKTSLPLSFLFPVLGHKSRSLSMDCTSYEDLSLTTFSYNVRRGAFCSLRFSKQLSGFRSYKPLLSARKFSRSSWPMPRYL